MLSAIEKKNKIKVSLLSQSKLYLEKLQVFNGSSIIFDRRLKFYGLTTTA